MYLRAGVPIRDALTKLVEDAHDSYSRYLYVTVLSSVTQGRSLSEALAAFKPAIREFTVSLIAMGETSGTLSDSLAYLAQELRKQEDLRKKLIGALIYPAIIVCAAFGIACFLTVYAFPKIVPIFRGFGTTLPLPTRILIVVSDAVAAYGWIVLAVLACAGFGFWFLMKKPRFVRRYEQLLLRTPLVGHVLSSYHLALIARMLSVQLKSGVPLISALELTARSGTNGIYTQSLIAVSSIVMDGARLADALSVQGKLFPRMFAQIVDTGESTGTLPEAFTELSVQYEADLEELTQNLTTLIEPVLMIAMGLLVGFIALAIITPVYQITQDIAL